MVACVVHSLIQPPLCRLPDWVLRRSIVQLFLAVAARPSMSPAPGPNAAALVAPVAQLSRRDHEVETAADKHDGDAEGDMLPSSSPNMGRRGTLAVSRGGGGGVKWGGVEWSGLDWREVEVNVRQRPPSNSQQPPSIDQPTQGLHFSPSPAAACRPLPALAAQQHSLPCCVNMLHVFRGYSDRVVRLTHIHSFPCTCACACS